MSSYLFQLFPFLLWFGIFFPNASSTSTQKILPTPSSNILEESVYYMSEYEYRPIGLDDYLDDYTFQSFNSNCNPQEIQIETEFTAKEVTYSETSLQNPLKDMIIFANKYALKVNCIALLSNNTLISFIDDATSLSNKSSTVLRNIQSFLIQNQDACSHLHKTSSTSFVFECTKTNPNSSQKVLTLFTFGQNDFSSPNGIDLSQLQYTQQNLIFDIFHAINNASLLNNEILINEYENCVRETSYYKNDVTGIAHYFRLCKFHETSQQQQDLLFTEAISSFFEMYDVSQQLDDIIGIFPKPDDGDGEEDDFKFSMQGAQQYADNYFVVLDYNDCMLFYNRQDDGLYHNVDFFIKYYYDLKYLNMFLMINLDLEFTIQDSVPNYLVINSQNYLLYYVLDNSGSQHTDFYLPYPSTVSISHFISQVQDIHDTNGDEIVLPNLYDVNSFQSIKFTFDSYLYYIEVTDSIQLSKYYLLIYRALTDTTNDMNLNPQAIEADFFSIGPYSNIFHYSLPGLFYINIRSRVRLFELSKPSQSSSPALAITTYSWQNTQQLQLRTQGFEIISLCNITLTLTPKLEKKGGLTLGQKKMNLNINLVPRNFKGVISKMGPNIALNFSNPMPILNIQSWFFGPAVIFDNYYTCSSKYAEMNVIQSSVTNVMNSTVPTENKKKSFQGNSTYKDIVCKEKLVAAIQSGEGYYIFYQYQDCSFFYERCMISQKAKSDMFTPEFNRELMNKCIKSLTLNLKAQVDKLIFDGENILFSTYSQMLSSSEETESSSEQVMENNQKDMKLYYINISSELQGEKDDTNMKTDSDTQEYLQSSNSPQQHSLKNVHKTKKFQSRPKERISGKQNLKESNKESSSTDSLYLSSPLLLDFKTNNNLLSQVIDLQIFCIPNTNKYTVIIQSGTANNKIMAIFRVNSGVKDLSIYTWADDSTIQNSYDVSLLDEGILFSSRNANSSASGYITIYKVNFLTKQIIVDTTFTSQDMIQQLQNLQNKAFTDEELSAEYQGMSLEDARNTKIQQIKDRNITFIESTQTFMVNFSVKVWRNDETQPYRLLIIDYQNNCLFDYYLIDLISPTFVRQIELYSFAIVSTQLLQITNDMMCLYTTSGKDSYLIYMQIDGDSIDQIKKIEKLSEKQSYTQVQQSLDTPYSQGTICGVYQVPIPQVKCIFNPYIQLNFDFTSEGQYNCRHYIESEDTYDNQVNFNISILSTLNETMQNITLLTNFSNFDTKLLNISANIPVTYQAQNGTVLGDQNKSKYQELYLNTSFVQGSIEQYFIDSSNQSQIDILQKNNITVQGYVNTNNVQFSLLNLSQEDNILNIDRNPYQMVGLAQDKIIVINQNLKFQFSIIFQVKYSDIQIFTQYPNDDFLYPYQIKSCNRIFSDAISSSQTTSTYLYLLQCTNSTSVQQQCISFTLDVNHFGSLRDQQFNWKSAMKNNVRLTKVQLAEEDFDDIINQITSVSILSLTDQLNNVGAFVILLVRQLCEESDPIENMDDTIYILWGENNQEEIDFKLVEIDQINSPDFDLNSLNINNFAANFPQSFQNQMRINLKKDLPKQSFVFNIGWDDGQRYVYLALFKINLPPTFNENGDASKINKEVFSIQYEDIDSSVFNDFTKSNQTWKSPFTKLSSLITYFQDSYNASILITNEFSIVEFQSILSPFPYLKSGVLGDSFNTMKNISIYTQYPWCQNQFSVNDQLQQILKYENMLVIECKSSSDVQQNQPQILKVYKIQDDSSDDQNSLSQGTSSLSSPTSSQIQSKKYSMVQAIEYESGMQIVSMEFRSDNLIQYLDLILNSTEKCNYQLYQYVVNQTPLIIYPTDIQNDLEVQICVKNRYTSSLCNTAVFSNVVINNTSLYVKQWLKFSGLVAVPLAISLTVIFTSFLAMKKLRKRRQKEFGDLMEGQSFPQYKSKSDLSSFTPPYFFSEKNLDKKVTSNNEALLPHTFSEESEDKKEFNTSIDFK